MATKTLTTSYLAQLTNANHDGVTQQIDDRFAEFETDNAMFIAARQTVHQARQGEDTALKRFSGKDFASDYTLAELGIQEWVQKAVVQAQKVLQLVALRVDHESAKVKGELAAARRATDEAIRKAYDVLNALAVLSPSTELTALINVLFGIEERAKLYYISGASASGVRPDAGDGGDTGGGSSSTDGGSSSESGGGSTGNFTPVQPENGGGSNTGGSSSGGSGGGDGDE